MQGQAEPSPLNSGVLRLATCPKSPLPCLDCLLSRMAALSSSLSSVFHSHPALVWAFSLKPYENHLPIPKASSPHLPLCLAM